MATITARRRVFMRYRAEDFQLYVLSLVLTGMLIAPALPHWFAQVLLVNALVYLACFFLIRHGVKADPTVLRVALGGLARYPVMLARNWRAAGTAVLPILAVFALALTVEHFLRRGLAGSRWLNPFPWQWVVWTAFLLITLFRVSILIAHLYRGAVVREVLEHSPQRKMIAVLSINHHILHAFVTGMLAHLSRMAPCVLFFTWTNPSNLREALLVAGCVLWSLIAIPLRRKGLETAGIVFKRVFYVNHTRDHRSRFYFTVFHGHHHDAIPTALIGAGAETGFLESADRALTWLDPLNSIVFAQAQLAYVIAFDMVVHQYIPGVFPFAKVTVIGTAHHVTHHFGSALPMGLIFRDYIESGDMNDGYKPNNTVTRWFVREVERRERLDPELGRKFLSLGDYGIVSETPSPSPDTAAETATVSQA